MRTNAKWLVTALVALPACGGDDDSGGHPAIVDAAQVVPADAAIDAVPDAPPVSMDIATACMHVCDKLAACAGEPGPATCTTECATDLADCTPSEVMQVDACSQEQCGQFGEGVGNCVGAIACVD